MTFKKTIAVAGAFATAFAVFASSASAQTAPAAAAAAPAPIRHGAAVPGVCFYNFDRALASSDVGKAVAARINLTLGRRITRMRTHRHPRQNREH